MTDKTLNEGKWLSKIKDLINPKPIPTYTVECNKEELLNGRSEAVQKYYVNDADSENLRKATGTAKSSIMFRYCKKAELYTEIYANL